MGSICSGARSDDVPEKTSIALDRKYKNVNLQDISGDICNQNVEAIVNPSNNVLSHRCGFSNYLIKKGGEIIQEQSDRYFQTISEEFHSLIYKVPPAAIVITSAGKLHAKYIIHVVSPLWTGGDHEEEHNLSKGISHVLSKADELGISSLAFPDFSGGIFGFPREVCAEIPVRTVIEYINKHPATNLRVIKFVAIDNIMVKLIKTEIQKWAVMDSLPNLRNSKSRNIDLEEEEQQQQNETAPLLFHKEKNTKFRSLVKTPSFGSRTAETTNEQYIEEKLRLNNARQI